MKATLLLLTIMLVTLAIPASAKEIPQKVDEKLGRELVYIITKHQGALSGPGVYDHFDDLDHPFLIYHQIGDYSGTVAWFAVNIWTGDVWDMGGEPCIHFDTPILRKELTKIKAHFSKEELKEYKRLSELRPGRMTDLEPCGSPVQE